MKAAVLCIIGLVGSWGHAKADPLVEGRVRLDSGAPVPGAQVLLFDLTDLRAAPLAATTDRSGQFTLPLATLGGALPERFELGANYPNPFNPSTMIPYQLPAAMHVRLEVFNILGQRIATLVDGERPAGFHTASWDATDAAGEAVAAGVYLYRLSGDGVQATRSMLLIDGQAGIPSGRGGSSGSGGEAGAGEDGATAPVYGLAVSGPGLVAYVDPAFRVQAGMAPLDLVVEAPGRVPPAKAASSGGILGDVDNTGGVDFFDALLVALYSHDSSTVMPNNGDIISLGDVNADGRVDLSDAWAIAAYLNDPSDPSLPAGIGEPVAAATASLSPDPSTVTFADDGAWHRFTVEAGEPVSVVANPEGTPRRLEITTRSGRGNFCPAEPDDDVARQDGQTIYLSGCSTGQATVELRRESDGTVLRTYTFEVTRSPADLVVESVSVSDKHPDHWAILHAQRHRSQPGNGGGRCHDPALVPFVEPDDLHPGYPGRHGRCGRTGGCRHQCRVDPPDRPVQCRHVLLRGLCGQRGGGERRQQLLYWNPRHGRGKESGSDRGNGLGQRQQSDSRAIFHAERHRPQPGHGSVGRYDAELLPLIGRDDFDPGYPGRHQPGGRTSRFGHRCGVDQPHRSVQ